jgi:hypothetical protein
MKIIVILIILLNGHLFAKSTFQMQACDLWQDIPSNLVKSMDAYKDRKITEIANLRAFYKVSDQLFKKLNIENNTEENVALERWAHETELVKKDKKDILIGWRKQFFYTTLLPSYRELSPIQKELVNSAFVDINNFAFPEEVKKTYEQLFIEAKQLVFRLVDQQNMKKDVKKIIKGRVAQTQLNWFSQIEGTQYEEDPTSYLKYDIRYQPKYKIISIGFHATRLTDGDTIISKFIQQMARSIDPCRWSISYPHFPYPYKNVLKCLREKGSVAAKKRDNSKIKKMFSEKKLTKKQKKSIEKFGTCNSAFYPPAGTQQEQIGVAFSDWFSAEAFSLVKELSRKFREDLCVESGQKDFHSYPRNKSRLERIYFANPKIRKLINVKNVKGVKYCKM